jgi:hypothetical protein
MMWIYPIHERWAFPGGAEVYEYGWRTRPTWGGHPISMKRPGLSAHMTRKRLATVVLDKYLKEAHDTTAAESPGKLASETTIAG